MRAGDLKRGTKLRLLRWRKGQSQVAAAAERGVSLNLYRRWENDEDGLKIPNESVGRIEPNEANVLRRWKSGLTTTQVCERIDCCRLWLRRMELGEVDFEKLTAFWGTMRG